MPSLQYSGMRRTPPQRGPIQHDVPTNLEIQADLFRQEHRFFALWSNLFDVLLGKYGEDDPRRKAILNAFALRVITALVPAFAAITVATAGLAGLAIAYQANIYLAEQNTYFREQNEYFKAQNQAITQQFEAAERTKLLRTLYEVEEPTWFENRLGAQKEPIANARLRSEALIAFVELERRRLGAGARVDLSRAQLQGVSVGKADLHDVNFSSADMTSVSFIGTNLSGANFSWTTLTKAEINADIRHANFVMADLQSANLEKAQLAGAIFTHANLEGMRINKQDWTDSLWRIAEEKVPIPFEAPFIRYYLTRKASAE